MIKLGRRTAAVTVLVAATAVLAPVGVASAADTGRHETIVPDTYGTFTNHVTQNYVRIHSGPGTSYTAVGQAQTGQALTDYCYTTGTLVNGNPYWDHIKDTATGISGYVTEYYLVDKSQTKHC